MKILINGCSFTGGTDVIHDENTGLLNNQNQFTWANEFTQDYEVTNLAIGGNSNNKILRTTLEELQCNDYDFVIIQWTGIYRTERFSEFIDNWVNYCNSAENTYGWHTDDFKHMDPDKASLKSALKSYSKVSEGLTNDALYNKSLQDFRIEYLKNVITMQHFLENNNIKYVFTSMSKENFCPNMLNHTSTNWNVSYDLNLKLLAVEKALLQQMNFNKWTNMPMTYMMEQNVVSQDDGHPNEKGHKLIYNRILKELNKQNG